VLAGQPHQQLHRHLDPSETDVDLPAEGCIADGAGMEAGPILVQAPARLDSQSRISGLKTLMRFASHFLMPHAGFARGWADARGLSLVDRVLKVTRIPWPGWVGGRESANLIGCGSTPAADSWARAITCEPRRPGTDSLGVRPETLNPAA